MPKEDKLEELLLNILNTLWGRSASRNIKQHLFKSTNAISKYVMVDVHTSADALRGACLHLLYVLAF